MSTVRLRHTARASRVARSSMLDDLSAAGLPRRVCADAEIVLGELVANAVEHGRADTDGMIEVSWALRAGSLVISVWDAGSTPAPLRPGSLADAEARGRGLAIVASVSRSWAHDGRHGTRVTAELDLP